MINHEPPTKYVTIYGSETAYWIYHPEQTKTIVMVHGFRGNHLGVRFIIAGLPQYRIVVPDLPGFGESLPMSARDHDIEGYSDFVREFIAHCEVTRPVLLGHSFGTIVAAHLAAHYSDLFAELILINPISVSPRKGLVTGTTTKLVEAYYWLGANLPEKWSQRVLKSRTFNRLMSLSLSRTRDPALRRLVYAHHLGDLNNPQHRQTIAQSFAASLSRTALDDAALINKKTLLIAGQKDPIVPVSTQRRLHATIAGSELILIPKVGHLIHLETPESASQAIANFLN